MSILDEIVANKKSEVAQRKEICPIKLLETSLYFEAKPVSLKKYLAREDRVGIIAEIKRKSPSKGMLNEYISVEELSIGYMQGGASALSVLTDAKYFSGSEEDLKEARKFNYCPILRKDFILDEYQVIESKAIGADVILLIARVLDAAQIKELSACAKSHGLEVLLEVYSEEELKAAPLENIDIIGVNNRNLDTFDTDYKTSLKLAKKIPNEFVKISESGIAKVETIKELKQAGFDGFLIGEAFMKSSQPHRACAKLIKELSED